MPRLRRRNCRLPGDFRCPIRFEQSCNAFWIVPLEYLAVPLRQADANLLRTLEEHALTPDGRADGNEPLPQRVKTRSGCCSKTVCRARSASPRNSI